MTLQRAHWFLTQGARARAGLGRNGRYLGRQSASGKGDELIYSNRPAENAPHDGCWFTGAGAADGGPMRMMSPNADWAPVPPIRQAPPRCGITLTRLTALRSIGITAR